MAKSRPSTGFAGTPSPGPAARSLKVVAVQTGFYPKDVRRRKGSVFTLADAAHFSDSEQQSVKRGKPTGLFGWMAWVDPMTPERAVTADDAMNERHGATSPANQDVI